MGGEVGCVASGALAQSDGFVDHRGFFDEFFHALECSARLCFDWLIMAGVAEGRRVDSE